MLSVVAGLLVGLVRTQANDGADARFQEANALARGGDYPGAMEAYRELGASGAESASLYWNWAQAAAARGAVGEAMWALLRGRDLEPGDDALDREIERVRQAANLDPAELAPEPLAVLGRLSRRFHLGLLALALAILSVACHGISRLWPDLTWPTPTGWTAFAVSLALAAVPMGASQARPTAVVVTRDAPLLESASPTAEILGSLREAEVVPILEASGDYLRIEDSSGARGWVHTGVAWPLDRHPGGDR
jgi:hypothetical protein